MVFVKVAVTMNRWFVFWHCFKIASGFIVSNDTEFHISTQMITSGLQQSTITPPTSFNTTECEDKIPTCSQYSQSICIDTMYMTWARYNCPMYCGFCTPPGYLQTICKDKLANCAEFDSGDLCTNPMYNAWRYENCGAYCKLDICNSNEKLCADSTNVDCQLLNTTIDLCTTIHKAKTICRKYCGLCDLTDGQWCSWSPWRSCDVTCANGTQLRTRQCACPAAAHGGLDCVGDSSLSRPCVSEPCPVHGGWSSWQNWGTCSVTCGIGLRRRDRTCSNPAPSRGGSRCYGDAFEDVVCFTSACSDGEWSSWSSWGSCSVTCEGGLSKRTRDCNNPSPSLLGHGCVGNSVDYKTCNTKQCFRARLAVGNRLEVSIDGLTWGTVCDDGFGDNEARVVCRMLGYSVDQATAVDPPDGVLPIVLDDVNCTGSEDSLLECNHRDWGANNCGHDEDVGVTCT